MAPSGGEPTLLARLEMGVGALSLSPDGRRFAFVASASHTPVKSYTQPDLWVLDVAPNAKPRNLTTAFDFDIGSGLTGDQAPPRAGGGNVPIWRADGRSIVVGFAKEGRLNLATVDAASGRLAELTKGDHAVMSYRMTTAASSSICCRRLHASEIFSLPTQPARMRDRSLASTTRFLRN